MVIGSAVSAATSANASTTMDTAGVCRRASWVWLMEAMDNNSEAGSAVDLDAAKRRATMLRSAGRPIFGGVDPG